MAGATVSMMPIRFMMRAASRPTNWSRTTARATVMPTDAPMPWISRPARIQSIDGAMAARTEPNR